MGHVAFLLHMGHEPCSLKLTAVVFLLGLFFVAVPLDPDLLWISGEGGISALTI